jgi:predicted nuclease of predicted toxin-antitoxin system
MPLRILADMGVSMRVVGRLRALGHDVIHLREQGLHRLPNGEIFARARSEGRIVLTFDLGFGEIVALSGGETVSVVLLRLGDTTTDFVARRLESVLASAEDALRSGAVVVVEDGRHRVRRLPLGS